MHSCSPDELRYHPLPGRESADPFADVPDLPVSVRLVRLTHDPQRRPHRHPDSSEVVYVVTGTGTAWQEGERRRVGPGDVLAIPAGAAHATLPDPGQRMELVCFFPHPDLAANLEELDGPVLG